MYQASIDMLLAAIVDIVGKVPREMPANQNFLEEVLVYVDKNFSSEITLDSIAGEFGYSKYYFSRMFNSLFGTNLNDYISIVRLGKAIEMLKERYCSVSEAALECGFPSIPTFYRALKKNYRYTTVKDLL
jgi:AraC-like DNA-binding protein